MKRYNPQNERIKREYFIFLKEAKGRSDSTIDNVRKSIDRFEQFSNYEDFRLFNKHKASAFKRYFSRERSHQNGKFLSKSTFVSTLRNLQDFFRWLRFQAGFKKIDINHIEYFNYKESDLNIARSRKIKDYPTLEQITALLLGLPNKSEIEKRNRALIAFTAMTGIRDSAIASLKIKHIDLDRGLVEQLPNEVKTKFSKTIYSTFLPVGQEIKQIFVDWIKYLREVKLYGENDPVFPRTKMSHDSNFELKPNGLEPIHWATANQIRKIFRESFELIGMKYYTPHSFRNMLVQIAQKICKTPEEFKAWSQSLGHESPLTTFTSYGKIDTFRQCELISNLESRAGEKSEKEILIEILKNLSQKSD